MSSAAEPLPVSPPLEGGSPANDADLRAENKLLRRRVAELELELRARHWGPRPVPEETLAALRAAYQNVDDERVMELLRAHPVLAPTLLDAAPRLRAAFGDAVTLHLRPPVFMDAGDPLFATVRGHGLEAAEATERMERFAESWLDREPFERREWLAVDVDFS